MSRLPLLRYLSPPLRDDYTRAPRARILHVMLLVTALAVLPMAAINLGSGAGGFATVLFSIGAICGLGVVLNHHNHYPLAAGLLALLVYFGTVYTIIDGAGFSDPGVVALPLFILFVGLFFDKRAILAATIVAVVTLVGIYALDRGGTLELAQHPGTGRTLTLCILMAVTGVIAWITSDLRERHLRDIRSRENRFRTLFEQSTDAIFIMEQDTFIDGNAGTLRMFGVRRDQILGKTPYDFSPPTQPSGQDSRSLSKERIRRAYQEGPQRFEWQHRRLDGSPVDVEVNLNRADLEGRQVLLAIVRDLTERRLAEQAAQEERQRLARELHDAVSQTLWSASLIADVLPELWEQDEQKGRDRLQRLRQLTQVALAEMRALLLELRPAALVERPLPELLQRLCEAVGSRTGWEVTLQADGDCRLEPEVHIGFYRIAQEALNNAARHAAASSIQVELQCRPDRATLTVRDDGRGFDPASPHTESHMGLGIMRERAAAIGAGITIESTPQAGTRIQVTCPGSAELAHA